MYKWNYRTRTTDRGVKLKKNCYYIDVKLIEPSPPHQPEHLSLAADEARWTFEVEGLIVRGVELSVAENDRVLKKDVPMETTLVLSSQQRAALEQAAEKTFQPAVAETLSKSQRKPKSSSEVLDISEGPHFPNECTKCDPGSNKKVQHKGRHVLTLEGTNRLELKRLYINAFQTSLSKSLDFEGNALSEELRVKFNARLTALEPSSALPPTSVPSRTALPSSSSASSSSSSPSVSLVRPASASASSSSSSL